MIKIINFSQKRKTFILLKNINIRNAVTKIKEKVKDEKIIFFKEIFLFKILLKIFDKKKFQVIHHLKFEVLTQKKENIIRNIVPLTSMHKLIEQKLFKLEFQCFFNLKIHNYQKKNEKIKGIEKILQFMTKKEKLIKKETILKLIYSVNFKNNFTNDEFNFLMFRSELFKIDKKFQKIDNMLKIFNKEKNDSTHLDLSNFENLEIILNRKLKKIAFFHIKVFRRFSTIGKIKRVSKTEHCSEISEKLLFRSVIESKNLIDFEHENKLSNAIQFLKQL